AQRPVALAVDDADSGSGLADRPVDAVLQQLLEAVGPHEVSLRPVTAAVGCAGRGFPSPRASPRFAEASARRVSLGVVTAAVGCAGRGFPSPRASPRFAEASA